MSCALRPVFRPSTFAPLTSSASSSPYICQQCRHARLLRRPKRPYTFTQLITLSDGSAFTLRTTSPQPVYRCSRDTRNAPLWNPSSKELLNVEEDEAGRLAGFRARFGTGFDIAKETGMGGEEVEEKSKEIRAAATTRKKEKEAGLEDDFGSEEDMNLLDLISSYGQPQSGGGQSGGGSGKKTGKK